MHWDAILRDSLRPAAPYVVWLGLALATRILVAIIREPLTRALREARQQIDVLRLRCLARSRISRGRRARRFWLLREYEPSRTVATSLDRLAEALPLVGKKTLRRGIALEDQLRRQVASLQKLGFEAPAHSPSDPSEQSTHPRATGSWWKLLTLLFIS